MARRTTWVDTLLDVDISGGAASLSTLLGGLTQIQTRGMTIVRTLVHIEFRKTAGTGVAGVMAVDVGIGVASADAFAAGVASVPDVTDPAAEPPRGWIYRSRVSMVDDSTQYPADRVMDADIRGKRRLDAGTLYLVVEGNTVFGSGFVINVGGIIRTLLLLP